MTRYTPASDILAILLIQSNYDPDTTLKQAILNVENYEHTHNRYFITWDGEFRFMFYWMALYLGVITFKDMEDSSGNLSDDYYDGIELFENITIRDWIKNILNYEVYESNDSDQMWLERGKERWFHVNGKHYLLDEKKYETTISYEEEKWEGLHLEGHNIHVKDFVREHLGSDERIRESALFDCKLRQFFENPGNINRKSIADFFKKNLKMDIIKSMVP
jgi:hypothetical protein